MAACQSWGPRAARRFLRRAGTPSYLLGRRAAAGVALAAGRASFFARELVRMAALVGGTATQARDLALALRIHRGKAAGAPALASGLGVTLPGGILQRHVQSFRDCGVGSNADVARSVPAV